MKIHGGWVWLVAVVGLHCSTTVTSTAATGDAAADAPRDAVAVDAPREPVVDFTSPPTALNPCAAERVVDLDRVGLATARGLGVVVHQSAAVDVQIGATDATCPRL